MSPGETAGFAMILPLPSISLFSIRVLLKAINSSRGLNLKFFASFLTAPTAVPISANFFPATSKNLLISLL